MAKYGNRIYMHEDRSAKSICYRARRIELAGSNASIYQVLVSEIGENWQVVTDVSNGD